ncbi:Hypothetical protein I595_519 [Croceitalea dokdonensis DOKDO 023]|uniref:Uncharacterized protein n=1 Tax=Croceitalea dokdonensis DOKDO 023 TaxID=1300341 RepID=A0A0P7ANQ9_9FLAO|nr:Hypothetical protein I595_519 [Croceitalea dokdonensis DOKDO 023]
MFKEMYAVEKETYDNKNGFSGVFKGIFYQASLQVIFF